MCFAVLKASNPLRIEHRLRGYCFNVVMRPFLINELLQYTVIMGGHFPATTS